MIHEILRFTQLKGNDLKHIPSDLGDAQERVPGRIARNQLAKALASQRLQ